MNKLVVFALFLLIGAFLIECSTPIKLQLTRKEKLTEYITMKRKAMGSKYVSNTVVPLLGNETLIGEYYVDVYLGSNNQHFTTQLDTGSSDLAIPDTSCSTCGKHPDGPYDSSKSSDSDSISCSSNKVTCPKCTSSQCSYSIAYGDGSGFDASVYLDDMTFGGLKAQQYFGAITQEHAGQGQSGFEPYPVDGIMGFAYGKISEIGAPTVFETLVNDGQIDNVFSMCLNATGGYLTLGEAGTHHTGNFVYTPIVQEQFYTIYLDDMSVFGNSIGVSADTYNRFGTIVDSGTTLLILPNAAYSALEDTLKDSCGSNNLVGICGVSNFVNIFNGFCYQMTEQEVMEYPPIRFTFGKGNSQIDVSISPKSYLRQGYCSDPSYYALAIAKGGLLSPLILGDTFMQNFETVFDRANTRVGFAPVHGCY
eukprot:TRINITY_DN14977_c0_g1_i1.p1 TRINITY_DN14977_c0_g1~~TRINITY_DN14977_c0_g1_i1.p1  ORF type:complete len:422 (-),score=152.86 TRINITY_DN14977_c0_g1_i1:174-1439(-)